MCEELNLTAAGKIDFAKPEILLGDVEILESFRQQARLLTRVNVSGVGLSVIEFTIRPSRDVASTSDYISPMPSTSPEGISTLEKLPCSRKFHLNMTRCPELGPSGEISTTLHLLMRELKPSEEILTPKSDLKLHTCLSSKQRAHHLSVDLPRSTN